MDISNICVIGNDKRMDYTADYFYSVGYDVYRELEYIDSKSLIVLPPPVGEQMTRQILPYIESGQNIYGGMLSDRLIHECNIRDVRIVDYLTCDEVTTENAILTAKGIIKEAACMNAVIYESNCLVTGYGFCAKELARELVNSGARVDIMARRRGLEYEISERGYGFIHMYNEQITAERLQKYSYVFNTVPAMVLDKEFIKLLPGNIMIFDIASAPGGTDFNYCNQNGIFAFHSLGIPGREFPKQAGEIIARYVLNDINI